MNPMLEEEYRAGLRRLLEENGVVVRIDEQERRRSPEDPSYWVSPYGWKDHDATQHVKSPTARDLATWGEEECNRYFGRCGLIIPAGASVEEVTYSEFQGTFVDNDSTVGINAYGGGRTSETSIHCTCGKYRGLTVRWEGSLRDALMAVLGLDRLRFTL